MATREPLQLSYDRGLLGGVCAGIAQWLGWNALVVRIFYVVLSIASAAFPGVLAYILLCLLMPNSRTRNHSFGG
jgi:phage shock protein C